MSIPFMPRNVLRREASAMEKSVANRAAGLIIVPVVIVIAVSIPWWASLIRKDSPSRNAPRREASAMEAAVAKKKLGGKIRAHPENRTEIHRKQ